MKTKATNGLVGFWRNKPSPSGVIIAALEVVQAGFSVVDIAPVAQGITQAQSRRHTAGGAQEPAPGVVG